MKHSNYKKRKKYDIKNQVTFESEQEIRKALEAFRLPLITRIFKKAWFYFLRYTFLPGFFLLVALFLIYNAIPGYTDVGEHIWNICKGITFFFIFGVGGFALLSTICEILSTDKLCRKLGLTESELQYYVNIFKIKGY